MAVLLATKLVAVGMALNARSIQTRPFTQVGENTTTTGLYPLRVVVCSVAGFAAFRASGIGKKGWTLAFVMVALLFESYRPGSPRP